MVDGIGKTIGAIAQRIKKHMTKLLSFIDSGYIVGRLTSKNAVLHYNWLQTVTIPNYNAISKDNTVIPSWEEFFTMVYTEMMHPDFTGAYKQYMRMAIEMSKRLYKDEFEVLAIQAKDAKADEHVKSKAKAKVAKADKADKADNTLETQVAMLTDLVTQLINNK